MRLLAGGGVRPAGGRWLVTSHSPSQKSNWRRGRWRGLGGEEKEDEGDGHANLRKRPRASIVRGTR